MKYRKKSNRLLEYTLHQVSIPTFMSYSRFKPNTWRITIYSLLFYTLLRGVLDPRTSIVVFRPEPLQTPSYYYYLKLPSLIILQVSTPSVFGVSSFIIRLVTIPRRITSGHKLTPLGYYLVSYSLRFTRSLVILEQLKLA